MKNVQRTLALALGAGIVCLTCRAYGISLLHTALLAAIVCIALFAFCFVSFGKRIKRSIAAVLFAAAFCVLGTLSGSAVLSKRDSDLSLSSDNEVRVTASVTEISYVEAFSSRLIAHVTEIDGSKSDLYAAIDFDGDPALYVHDVFVATGSFSPLGADETFFESKSVFVGFKASDAEFVASGEGGFFDNVRDFGLSLSEKLYSAVGGDEGRIASAIALGDKSKLKSEQKLDFRRAGASHILAVSGLHLSVLVLFFRFATGFAGRKKRNAVLIAATLFYMALTGFSPSVSRAGIMVCVFLLGEIIGEEGDGITSLLIAMAAILTVSPEAVFNAGFWLSCSATLGILIVSPAFKLKLLLPKDEDRTALKIIKKAAKYVVTLIIASLAAQIFTVPILYLSFGGISVAGLLSGLILIPLAGIALILSMLSCIFMFIPPVASALAFVAGKPISLILAVARAISSWSGVYVSIRQPFATYIIAAGAVVITLIVFIKKIDRRFILAVGAVCVAAFCASSAIFSSMRAGMTEIVYTVDGTNDSIAVITRGNTFIIDISNGGYGALGSALESVDDAYFEEVDYVVLTHLHANHIASLQKLVSGVKVNNIVVPTPVTESDAAIADSIYLLLGKTTNLIWYDRGEKSEITADTVKITLPDYVMIKRSTHPLTAFCIEENGHRLTYLGASCADTDDEWVNDIYLNSDCLIVGSHGPKTDRLLHIGSSAAGTVVFGVDPESAADTGGVDKTIIRASDSGGKVVIRFENE